MSRSRGARRHFRRAVLAAVLLAIGIPAMARGASPEAVTPGPVTAFAVQGNTVEITALRARAKLVFHTDDLFRIWMAPDGIFADPANTPPQRSGAPAANIVVKTDYPGVTPEATDAGTYHLLRTKALALRVYKTQLRFALYRPDDRTAIWEEVVGPTWDGRQTTQVLSRGASEQFFGGGMQNGRFSHRDQTIKVAVSYDWDDGGHPNSAPFYLSTAGYGVLRNTLAAGSYAFSAPVLTSHEENRFDAYYFVGDLKRVIDRYTELTGRPFLPPIYGLEMGDADCYLHSARHGEISTLDSLAVADQYVKHRVPLGWMLVNDGYGCGYEYLDEVAAGLRGRNMELGLWTATGLGSHAAEVRAGVRVRKLDIGWVAPGYRAALSACEDAYRGMERDTDIRGFVWLPEGWAGSQRCGVHWSGDQKGNWESIRWQIPTYAGATMSGQAYTTSDVDGIFEGSTQTYLRDLQWKALLPTGIAMNGWSVRHKRPWRDGEPYLSANRSYFLLRERLIPYQYTYAAQAHRTGVGAVRPLVLEYPNDPKTWGEAVRYQFMVGDAFLVAPVYSDTTVRDGIYLPTGTWTDYWSGRTHVGPQTLNGYEAPPDRLPLFVKGGSIIPMWPEGTLSWRTRDRGRLDLDVYPDRPGSFTVYEDDGVSRGYARGEYAEQTFTVTPGPAGVTVGIGPSVGSYAGKVDRRRYRLTVHDGGTTTVVVAGGEVLPRYDDQAAYAAAATGWYRDPARAGITDIKIGALPADASATVTLSR
ncbi:MAG TPA: TIM-barrel domain-containing protein [Acidimicrobiia bacterium]|nr:TIM-barrel domain-containing protein [Acidimicrobiia bacterium]